MPVATNEKSILKVENLQMEAGGVEILSWVSFSLEKGEALAIIGPNGAGKTMLFRALIGAFPYKGAVEWQKGVSIGYVPQKIDIERDLPLTVKEFLDLKLNIIKKTGEISFDAPKRALEWVDLPLEIAKKRIGELSAGQFQRVLIAWALLGKPNVLLFDEPTANVDVHGGETIYELLHRLQDQHGLTLLLISHDLNIVYRYATKVLCLNKVQICFGTPRRVLTTEELHKLYGGDSVFYQHLHSEHF